MEPDSSAKITVTVNGQQQEVASGLTISELLEIVDLPGPYLAVELNEDVVPREHHDTRHVHDGDAVEVVTLVGGG